MEQHRSFEKSGCTVSHTCKLPEKYVLLEVRSKSMVYNEKLNQMLSKKSLCKSKLWAGSNNYQLDMQLVTELYSESADRWPVLILKGDNK